MIRTSEEIRADLRQQNNAFNQGSWFPEALALQMPATSSPDWRLRILQRLRFLC